MSRIHIFTLALDAMPFLPAQLATFNRLKVDWSWHVVEGAAAPVKDTGWCKSIQPRLSRDGTTQFLNSLRDHPRVRVSQKMLWQGKVEMCNAALEAVSKPCILLQVDADEIWTAEQIEGIVAMFSEAPTYNCARFFCRYFVGPNLIAITPNAYGNNPGEWLRAWRFYPGFKFLSHEPPRLSGVNDFEEICNGRAEQSCERCIDRVATQGLGLMFDHLAYVYPSQVEFKEHYYGYANALEHWQRLQRYQGPWPAKLKKFLPWVDDRAMVSTLHRA